MDLILDAEAENPNARALNYVSMVGGSEHTIVLRDELADETYEVRPKLLVNAAGPWIDLTNRSLGLSTRFIGGTKGSHIVVKHEELRKTIGEHEFFFENEDGRIVLIFPLYDRVLIGTSDIPVEHPDEGVCTDEEIEYFLKLTRRIFSPAGVAAVRAIAQNAPMLIVSGMQPYMDYTLLGAKGITTVNDLKGKVVGVTGPGGIAEFASVEGLAKKGLVRDRDYKILYGVGNSPARAQALESGKIHASPFSFLERLELEKKGYPTLFDIGEVIPGFPFVVIAAGRQKIDTDPDGIVALLRGLNRGLDFLKANPDRVADAVIKKNTFGDPATVRRVVRQFSGVYSTSITREDIESLITATRIEAEAKKLGGPEKFFTRQFLLKATGR